MDVYTIKLFSPLLFIFEIFHNQKNLKPPFKKKKTVSLSLWGITTSLWSTDDYGVENITSVFVGILKKTQE